MVYDGIVGQGLCCDGRSWFMLGWWGKVYAGMMWQGLCQEYGLCLDSIEGFIHRW